MKEQEAILLPIYDEVFSDNIGAQHESLSTTSTGLQRGLTGESEQQPPTYDEAQKQKMCEWWEWRRQQRREKWEQLIGPGEWHDGWRKFGGEGG